MCVPTNTRYQSQDDNENAKTNGRLGTTILPQRVVKTVSFGGVVVRSYERILGDHPCCKRGVPLGLGWNWYEENTWDNLDKYEMEALFPHGNNKRKNATVSARKLSQQERQKLLERFGFSRCCIAALDQYRHTQHPQRNNTTTTVKRTPRNVTRNAHAAVVPFRPVVLQPAGKTISKSKAVAKHRLHNIRQLGKLQNHRSKVNV